MQRGRPLSLPHLTMLGATPPQVVAAAAAAGFDAVSLRYNSRALTAAIGAAAPGRHDSLEIALGEDFFGAAPGQTAVLMDGETIVGHGTIVAAS